MKLLHRINDMLFNGYKEGKTPKRIIVDHKDRADLLTEAFPYYKVGENGDLITIFTSPLGVFPVEFKDLPTCIVWDKGLL